MRIVAPIPVDAVNAIYRVVVPMQALAGRGHTVHIDEANEIRNPETLTEFDCVLLWRGFGEDHERIVRMLRDAGVAVVWDNDDDIAGIPRDHPSYREQGGLRGRQVMQSMTRIMKAAHVVTTPSQTLADLYREASGSDVRVLENHLPPIFVQPRQPNRGGGVVIGWVAATEHRTDLDKLGIRETLERLLEHHPHVQVVSIGLNLGIRNERYTAQPTMRYVDLPGQLGVWDIGIAPIADTRLNRARSNVKLKEYGALGLAWLASPIGPYAEMGERQGGRLVPDDGWYDALDRLVTDPGQTQRLGRQAAAWARSETIGVNAYLWEQALSDAVELAHANGR